MVSDHILVSEEGVNGALAALGVEHELGVVVAALLEVDDLFKVCAGALGDARAELEELGSVPVGATVDAGGVAAEIVDGGGADGLEVLVHYLGGLVVVLLEGGDDLVLSIASNSLAVLKEISEFAFNVAGSALELFLGLVGGLFVELELTATCAEAGDVETVLPVAGLGVESVCIPALNTAFGIAVALHGRVVEGLANVLDDGTDSLTPLHDDLADTVLVCVFKGLSEVLGSLFGGPLLVVVVLVPLLSDRVSSLLDLVPVHADLVGVPGGGVSVVVVGSESDDSHSGESHDDALHFKDSDGI